MSEESDMDIDYVANLARIELSSQEKEKFQGQLGDVLKYFEKLQEVDVEGVEPTAHAFPRFNVWDEDQSVDCLLYTSPSPRDLSTSRMPSSA